MATSAQIEANRQNAQHSSGPTSQAGKERSSMNNFRHGLTGHVFFILKWEHEEVYDSLKEAFNREYHPSTVTEHLLVEKMVQHHWLSQRAQGLVTEYIELDTLLPEVQKSINTLARYELMHERLFKSALHDLLKLRAEKRKAEIGFESQRRIEAGETRKAETHKLKISMLETRLERDKTANFLKAAKLAEELERVLPPEMLPQAA